MYISTLFKPRYVRRIPFQAYFVYPNGFIYKEPIFWNYYVSFVDEYNFGNSIMP